ncbi:hypothetical protein [Alkaliphilus metalliredigens]|nr:hypothetical protein [Alkaliphilus metalliredigens]
MKRIVNWYCDQLIEITRTLLMSKSGSLFYPRNENDFEYELRNVG